TQLLATLDGDTNAQTTLTVQVNSGNTIPTLYICAADAANNLPANVTTTVMMTSSSLDLSGGVSVVNTTATASKTSCAVFSGLLTTGAKVGTYTLSFS